MFFASRCIPRCRFGTLEELIAYAKGNPGKLSYGHAGVGSIQHLTGELFKSLAGTPDIVDVPYRGTGPLVADLIGGQVPMGTPGVTGQVLEFTGPASCEFSP
jgi:tripartite-type tricarboxylate transporter receptor subunit TctC